MPRPTRTREPQDFNDHEGNRAMAAAVDYLGAIEREVTLLKSTLEQSHFLTHAVREQIEASADYIDRNLRAIKAGYLYQPKTTRKT